MLMFKRKHKPTNWFRGLKYAESVAQSQDPQELTHQVCTNEFAESSDGFLSGVTDYQKHLRDRLKK